MRLALSMLSGTFAGTLAGTLAGTAHALTPLPACFGSTESGMDIGDVRALQVTGVVIEGYSALYEVDAEGYVTPGKGPVEALNGFSGIRVVHCASGRFAAIRGEVATAAVQAALEGSARIGKTLKSGRPVKADPLMQAVRELYGSVNVIELREDEETCGCNTYFPELKPKGMTPWEQRADQTVQ